MNARFSILRFSALLVLCAFATSCKTLHITVGKKNKDDAAAVAAVEEPVQENEWKESYQEAREKYSGKPGWNDVGNVPTASNPASGVTYSRVSVGQPYVAMTFDDGPHPSNTPRLLDMLKQRNIKATFFVVGTNARAYPHILKRMVAEGHEVASHTWSHGYMTKMSESSLREEFDSSRNAIVAATGVPPKVYRPPYGAINTNLKAWMKEEYGYPTIMWSVDPMDWKRPGASVVADRLVSGAHNGAILLAHDIHSPTIDAMPSALDRLLAKGYKFVTVSQLIALGEGGTTASAPIAKPIGAADPLPSQSEAAN